MRIHARCPSLLAAMAAASSSSLLLLLLLRPSSIDGAHTINYAPECPSDTECLLCPHPSAELSGSGNRIDVFFLPDPVTGVTPTECECTHEEKACADGTVVFRNVDLYCDLDPCPPLEAAPTITLLAAAGGSDAPEEEQEEAVSFVSIAVEPPVPLVQCPCPLNEYRDEPLYYVSHLNIEEECPTTMQELPHGICPDVAISMVSSNPPIMCVCPEGTVEDGPWYQRLGSCDGDPPTDAECPLILKECDCDGDGSFDGESDVETDVDADCEAACLAATSGGSPAVLAKEKSGKADGPMGKGPDGEGPPGQDKKEEAQVPPGQAKKADTEETPGVYYIRGKDDEARGSSMGKGPDGEGPPGQDKKDEAQGPPGQAKEADTEETPGVDDVHEEDDGATNSSMGKGPDGEGPPGQLKKGEASAGDAAPEEGQEHVACSTVPPGRAGSLCDKYCHQDDCMSLVGGIRRNRHLLRRGLKDPLEECNQLARLYEEETGKTLDCDVE